MHVFQLRACGAGELDIDSATFVYVCICTAVLITRTGCVIWRDTHTEFNYVHVA